MRAALIAIGLWATLATLAFRLQHLPPFLLTGIGLCTGALLLAPGWRQWRVPWPVFLIGSIALLSYHAALFTALQWAPPVAANLLNYLWPLLIVLLAPLHDRAQRWSRRALFAAGLGFGGAALAIVGEQGLQFESRALAGYALALLAALIWSNYSLALRRLPAFPSAAVGGFNLCAGLGSLAIAALVEPLPALSLNDVLLLLLIGAGPLGIAFFYWDRAAKTCPAGTLGVLSFLTPVLSTSALMLSTGQLPGPALLAGALLVLMATALVMWPAPARA